MSESYGFHAAYDFCAFTNWRESLTIAQGRLTLWKVNTTVNRGEVEHTEMTWNIRTGIVFKQIVSLSQRE